MAAQPPTTPCPTCGTALLPGAKFCNVCGASSDAKPTADAAPKKAGNQTVMGIAPPMFDRDPAAARLPPKSREAAAPAPPPPPPPPPPPSTADRPKAPGATLIGVAAPEIAPLSHGPKNVPNSTMMGVALPGIAPTHRLPPSQRKSSRPPPPAQPTAAPNEGVAPETRRLAPAKPALRWSVVVLLMLAAAGATGVITYVLRAPKPPVLTAELQPDPIAPKLLIACEACVDDTSILIGAGHAAKFKDKRALVTLAADELKAGRNKFPSKVTAPGKKSHDIELAVDLPFLVHASLDPLARGESAVDLVFDLAPDVKKVEVDDPTAKTLATGKPHRIVIPPPEGDARSFERLVAYRVTWRDDKPIAGSIKLSIPYVPLRLGLPGRHPIAFGEELEVSGRSLPAATIWLGASDDAPSTTADKEGIFRVRANLASGQTKLTLRATAGKHAPRTLVLDVTRASSKADALKALRSAAKTPIATIAQKPEAHVGEAVVFKMRVAQTGEEDARGLAVGEVACKAESEPCPAVRVLLPFGPAPAKGATIEVLGRVTRAMPVDKGKSTAPEIDAVAILP